MAHVPLDTATLEDWGCANSMVVMVPAQHQQPAARGADPRGRCHLAELRELKRRPACLRPWACWQTVAPLPARASKVCEGEVQLMRVAERAMPPTPRQAHTVAGVGTGRGLALWLTPPRTTRCVAAASCSAFSRALRIHACSTEHMRAACQPQHPHAKLTHRSARTFTVMTVWCGWSHLSTGDMRLLL